MFVVMRNILRRGIPRWFLLSLGGPQFEEALFIVVYGLADGVDGGDEIVAEGYLGVANFSWCTDPGSKKFFGEGVFAASVLALPMYLHVRRAMKTLMEGMFSKSALTISLVMCCSLTRSQV